MKLILISRLSKIVICGLTVFQDINMIISVSRLTAQTENQVDKDQSLKSRRFNRKRIVRILIFVYNLYKY